MSPLPRHSDTDPGWIKREHRKLWRAIRESNAAKRLQGATIGRGGITVKDEGYITVEAERDKLVIGPYLSDIGLLGSTIEISEKDEAGNIITDDSGGAFGVHHRISQFGENSWNILFRGDLADIRAGTVNLVTDLFLVDGAGNNRIYMQDAVGLILEHADGIYLAGGGATQMLVDSAGVKVFPAATAAAANAVIDVNGVIKFSTSSKRYKRDIEVLEVDEDAILALTPRLCRMKTEVEELGDEAPTYPVFIAEEAADLGLHDWVSFDEEGPKTFDYSGFCVAQQLVLRRQQARLVELEERVAALETPGRAAKK